MPLPPGSSFLFIYANVFNSMKYKVILFDADGVTIEPGLMFSQILERDYGVPSKQLSDFFSGVFQDCMDGKADLKVELQKVIADWGWTQTVDDLLHEWFSFENNPDTAMLDLIQELRSKGIQCYLSTNQEKYRGDFLRIEMGFDKLFDGLFISAEVGYKKKNPMYFETVFNRISATSSSLSSTLLQKEEILFIDDETENTDSARTFGICSHLFTSIENLKAELSKAGL